MNPLIDKLTSLMPPSGIYPQNVIQEIKPKVRGRSFFPGGSGQFGGHQSLLRSRPIMLVGQDFGTLAYWNELEGETDEKLQGTWSSLKRMLAPTGISPDDCFYTNALLGVRVSGPIDNPSPGLDHAKYVDACLEFLIAQIEIVQPSVIVTLGLVPSALAVRQLGLTSSLPAPTSKGAASWLQVDCEGFQFVENVKIPRCAPFAFATSVHPDRHWLHTKHRSWRSLTGNDAHDAIWSSIRASSRGRDSLHG